MIDGRRRTRMRIALKTPVAIPTPTSAKAPGISPSVDVVGVIVNDAVTTHIVIRAATDTSKPPTSSALVWPSEARASGIVVSRRFPRL
jgi:hypothetical protein